ncbi:MAG: hypothetical protein WCL50_01565 [Spirochaetota bacterium]
MKTGSIAIILSLALSAALGAQDAPLVQTSFDAELGAVKVLSHTYRVGTAGTASEFDFVAQGGQEILQPFERLTAIFTIAGDHQLRFLYQPLSLDTQTVFRNPVVIDGTTFAAQTPMRLSYGFPFYRLTYQYRFLRNEGSWLAGGAALQVRNASIRFESLDGRQLVVSQNLGLVPALALSGRLALGGGIWTAFDATGIYASSAFINGANFSFEGSLLDASLRVGTTLRDIGDVYVNLRFLGGTADGSSGYARAEWTNSLSPTTSNHLATASLTIGSTLRP